MAELASLSDLRQRLPACARHPLAAITTPSSCPTPQPQPTWVESSLAYGATLPAGLKYNADGYQLRYTIAAASGASHVILGPDDLSGFGQQRTQFAEFTELGDLSLKYPTISRAYIGVINKTLVLTPRRYSIVRGKSGCSATCLARVDTSPSSSSQCAFDFSFTIAPEVSSIDLARLTEEIGKQSDLSGYQITFADSLQTKPPSTLPTAFATNVQFVAGANPHTFALTVTVQDAGPTAPAVANANLLILQLSGQSGTDLIGSFSLKLDDGYPDPVLAPIDLNFAHTAGSDEVLAQINQSSQAIQVANGSPLDLQMQNYALIQGASLTEVAKPMLIPAGGSVSLPLPANSDGLAFCVRGTARLASFDGCCGGYEISEFPDRRRAEHSLRCSAGRLGRRLCQGCVRRMHCHAPYLVICRAVADNVDREFEVRHQPHTNPD
jgi:hypothetical protein